jgi:hypothetical protein
VSTSFVVSGAGELPEGSASPEDVVRRGETSPNAMAAKARCVLGLREGRLRGLGANCSQVTATDIYTVHDVNALLAVYCSHRPADSTALRCASTYHFISTKWTCRRHEGKSRQRRNDPE